MKRKTINSAISTIYDGKKKPYKKAQFPAKSLLNQKKNTVKPQQKAKKSSGQMMEEVK